MASTYFTRETRKHSTSAQRKLGYMRASPSMNMSCTSRSECENAGSSGFRYFGVHEGATAEVGTIDERRHLDDRREGDPAIGDVRHVKVSERSLQQERGTHDSLVLDPLQPGLLVARESGTQPGG